MNDTFTVKGKNKALTVNVSVNMQADALTLERAYAAFYTAADAFMIRNTEETQTAVGIKLGELMMVTIGVIQAISLLLFYEGDHERFVSDVTAYFDGRFLKLFKKAYRRTCGREPEIHVYAHQG